MHRTAPDYTGLAVSILLAGAAPVIGKYIPTEPDNIGFILYWGFIVVLAAALILYGFILLSGSIRILFIRPEKPLNIGLVAGLLAGLIGGVGYATTCPYPGCNLSEIVVIKYMRILAICGFLGIAFSIVFTLIDTLVRRQTGHKIYLPAATAFALTFGLLGVIAAEFLDDIGSLLSRAGITTIGSGTCESVVNPEPGCTIELGKISFASMTLIIALYLAFYIYLRFWARSIWTGLVFVFGLCAIGFTASFLVDDPNLAGPLDTMREAILAHPLGAVGFVTPWIVLALLFYWISSRRAHAGRNG